jgi:hypothetical protein
MRLLVVTSCTQKKAASLRNELRREDFASPDRLREREREVESHRIPAVAMYRGDQHLNVVEGVRRIRSAEGNGSVGVRIVSAGYGLIHENREIVPYNVTFSGKNRRQICHRAAELGIPQAVRKEVRGWPLVIYLLGDDYLTAIDAQLKCGGSYDRLVPEKTQRFVFLARPKKALELTARGVTGVSVGAPEARRFHSGYIALKGRLFELYARSLAREGDVLWRATIVDDTPATFMDAMERGSDLE